MGGKARIELELSKTYAKPVVKRELQQVVEEIARYVPGPKAQDMMYDLVHVVLELEERIIDLESRISYGDPRKELERRELHRHQS